MKKLTNLLITCFLSGVMILTGCKDEVDPLTLSTVAVTDVTLTSAKSGGVIRGDGGDVVAARGVVWSTHKEPTTADNFTINGSGSGDFTSEITGLTHSTTYFTRAYAKNSVETSYGNELSFNTEAPGLAKVTTVQITGLTSVAVVIGGNVTSDGGMAVTERGVCWGIAPNPTADDNKTTDGNGNGEFSSNISGLSNGTVYYVRSYASNIFGIAYGNEITFITPVTDVEGNVYKTVKIGNQVWMAENLRAVRYRNNTAIRHVTDSITWMTLTGHGYAWYRNNAANKEKHGALYNWFTVATGNLCPQGWHVPTNEEFHALEKQIGIPADSVGFWGWRGNGSATKLKDSVGWLTGAGNNSSGFSATGSGYRAWSDSQFRGLNEIAYYWTATDDAINNKPDVAWYRRIDGARNFVYKATTGKEGGKSIRCVKN